MQHLYLVDVLMLFAAPMLEITTHRPAGHSVLKTVDAIPFRSWLTPFFVLFFSLIAGLFRQPFRYLPQSPKDTKAHKDFLSAGRRTKIALDQRSGFKLGKLCHNRYFVLLSGFVTWRLNRCLFGLRYLPKIVVWLLFKTDFRQTGKNAG